MTCMKTMYQHLTSSEIQLLVVVVMAGPLLALTTNSSSPGPHLKETSFDLLPLNDVLFAEDVLLEVSARSRIDCSKKCVETEGCVMCTFLSSPQGPPGHCRLHSQLQNAADVKDSMPGARSVVPANSSSSKMCLIIYYHYTDREGLRGILASRKICKSPSGRYGEGVYLTTLAPSHGRAKVARNNWDGSWVSTEGSGKVDYTISVRLPEGKVEQHGDIYVFREDVDLDKTTYRLYSKNEDHEDLDPGRNGIALEKLLGTSKRTRKSSHNCRTM